MRNTLIRCAQRQVDDEVFLMKYSHNSIESIQNLLYIEMEIYTRRLLDILKKENEPKKNQATATPIGNPKIPGLD
jgi:hypothetical protein